MVVTEGETNIRGRIDMLLVAAILLGIFVYPASGENWPGEPECCKIACDGIQSCENPDCVYPY